MKKNLQTIFFILIIVLAFIARSYLLSQEGFITTDGVAYAISGKNLTETGRFEIYEKPQLLFPPGYPIAIGIADVFFDDLTFSARFVSFLSGILFVYIIYLIGRRMRGEKVGLLVSFLAATQPMLVILSAESMSESFYYLFVVLAVYQYLKIIEKYTLGGAIILGATIGYCYLIRPEGILLLVLVPAFLWAKHVSLSRKALASSFLAIIISFSIVSAPYIYFLYKNSGKLAITTKSGPNLVTGIILNGKIIGEANDKEARAYEKTFYYYDSETNSIKLPEKFDKLDLSGSILGNWKMFLERYAKGLETEIKMMFKAYELILFLPFVAVYFVFISRRREEFGRHIVLFVIPLSFLLLFPAFHIEARYLVQVFIFIILLSSLGLAVFLDFLARKINKLEFANNIFCGPVKGVAAFILISAFTASAAAALWPGAPYPYEHKIAGEYLKSQGNGSDIVVMSRKPYVNFYAQGKGNFPIPYTSAANVLRFAKANKVNYIVIDERYIGLRENYEELLSLDKYAADEVILFYQDYSVKPIKIFKVLH